MPNNRNAQLRYRIIDRCLQNRSRKWNWEDIVEKINEALTEINPNTAGIGKSTFYEDLKYMETVLYKNEIEIERIREGKKVYFRYLNPNISVNMQLLDAREIEVIKSSVSVMSKFRGVPQFEWLNEMIPILESKFGLLGCDKEIISFESNVDYSGSIFISPLFNAIFNKRVTKITYQDFKSPVAYDVEVYPQYLKQYNSRWFLIGLQKERGDELRTYALDRIKNIQEMRGKYIELKNFDWDNYFSDMIGVSRIETKPIEVQLLILDSEQASYIETKPLHQTQKKMKKVENGYQTSIFVIPNYELEKLILSFGERIVVMSPEDLRLRLKEKIKKLHQNY